MKKILIDVGHPAQVHNFKYIARELESKGWVVLFTAKDKEVTRYLLEFYKFNYRLISKTKSGLLLKMVGLISDTVSFIRIVQEFKPSLVLSRTSLYSGISCKFMGIPNIAMADTENSLNVAFLFSSILTNSAFERNLGKKQIYFKGNIELCYLHPKRFEEKGKIEKILNLPEGEPFAIVRFVSWNAHHDIGQGGISESEKIRFLEHISNQMKVVISSEKKLPEAFLKYAVRIPPEFMHDALKQALIYVGEGGTMASEAACLGTPAIYINSLEPGYIKEERDFGLIKSYRNLSVEDALLFIKEVRDSLWISNIESFMSNKIDVSAFMVWFIENYPESFKIMKDNPDYQNRFK